jgi:serine protease Do
MRNGLDMDVKRKGITSPIYLPKVAVMLVSALLLLLAQASAARGLPEFTDLIEDSSPAVVKINTVERKRVGRNFQIPQHPDIPDIFRHLFDPRSMPERQSQAMGSGFLISDDGYILTNNHVVDGADEIQVRLIDRREFDALVIGADERSDLALLKIEASDLPYLKFAKPNSLKVGEWVLAIGSPFGLDYSASAGIVSAIGRSIPTEKNENYVPFIQTDVAINPGNSGGPLFNLKGEVVGINSQIYTRSGGSIGLSFAIPVAVAQGVVEQLKEKGRVDRGWLGVVIQEVSRDLASSFGLSKPMGALVAQLEPKGPADMAGIRVGDVIIEFDGNPILMSSDLPHAVGRTVPGRSVPVVVMREGKKRALNVEVGVLGGGEASPQVSEAPVGGGRLGLEVQELDERISKRWNLTAGVIITQVVPGGAGAKAGLHPGDVIAQLGFHEIGSVDDYRRVESELPANELLPIRYFRRGRPAFHTFRIDE